METMETDGAVRQYNMGVALMKTGKYEDAVKAFRIAAEKGMPEAQYNLGYCYSNGKGVEKDMVEAVKWLRKAAEKGMPEAQWAMAGCYAGGEGVEKDMGEAVRWARKAARQGHPIAKKALKELGESEE